MSSPLCLRHLLISYLYFSVVRLQNELNNFSLHKSASEPAIVAPTIPQPAQDSSPDTPQPAPYDLNKGWITGIFGCLRPVLSIIGKGAVNEIKNSHQGTVFKNENQRFKFFSR